MTSRHLRRISLFLGGLVFCVSCAVWKQAPATRADAPPPPLLEGDPSLPSSVAWQPVPPELARIDEIPDRKERDLVRYGKELFLYTAYYLGPKGKIGRYGGNPMNCQNCHLNGGLKKFGNDLVHTKGRYPSYRAREGKVLSLADRINNCIERPLNGKPLPMDSREMKAIHAYISWLSTAPLAREVLPGENLPRLTYLTRAADPKRGATLYAQHCARCHGVNGEGLMHTDGIAFLYPALWGPQSFESGSSMHRVTMMAKFVKANMPFGTTWDRPLLSDEEALDVASFVLDPKQHTRPVRFDPKKDYPNIADKPIDLAMGPYTDPFSEEQHRLGPFGEIAEYYRLRRVATKK